MDELKSSMAGLASVVEFANTKGYDISIDEAKAHIREQAKEELSDDQLDSIAGGKDHHSTATETAVATQNVVETQNAVAVHNAVDAVVAIVLI